MLRTACTEAARWERPLSIAVNVSAMQLHSPNFAPLVHEILITTKLSPQRLELEITETALIRDLTRALTTLRQLKALGVHIAMDDFGTGYSSLANLRAFPFDKLKIDKSFITSVDDNEQSAAIVRAVLGLGRGLICRSSRKAWKRPRNCKFLAPSSAARRRAICSASPLRSRHSRDVTSATPGHAAHKTRGKRRLAAEPEPAFQPYGRVRSLRLRLIHAPLSGQSAVRAT